jgi:hypothetical protein
MKVALHQNHYDRDYEDFVSQLQTRFTSLINNGTEPLFVVECDNLWDLYLSGFADADERQYHNCHCCKRFIEQFGGLVTINDAGLHSSVLWHTDDVPIVYRDSFKAMSKAVRRSDIRSVFVSADKVWGTPEAGGWQHLFITPPVSILHNKRTTTPFQVMAEKKEDFKNVRRSLAEFNEHTISTAMTLLETDSLYRSEKVIGPAKWLSQLHADMKTAKKKDGVIWRAIATAPAGFCHPRSSMIGTLLEDIAEGLSYDAVSRRFSTKMHSLSYQRPQAAPTEGAIAQAEKLMNQLGAAGSLARRFARLDEVKAIWRPLQKETSKGGGSLFGHLKAKGEIAEQQLRIPAKVMTWEKFQREVLMTAERIELLPPSHGSFTAFLTSVNEDAPPIIQWDTEDCRNPVSWYFYNGGATASSFGVKAGSFTDVDAIALKPSMWNGGYEHHGKAIFFALRAAKESRQPTLCLFPEILKSEFHGVRSVIEAYSSNANVEGLNEPHVAGLMLSNTQTWNILLRVTVAGRTMEYMIDRFE